MAHAREEDRDARLMGPHVGGFLRDLSHPHDVLRRIEVREGRGILIQLITQHEHEVARGGAVSRPWS
jgi:hypothetical protein